MRRSPAGSSREIIAQVQEASAKREADGGDEAMPPGRLVATGQMLAEVPSSFAVRSQEPPEPIQAGNQKYVKMGPSGSRDCKMILPRTCKKTEREGKEQNDREKV
ncbi:Hypothetical predicted protein [Podarcis lilfordi]|uniref:Uncharacterized protein n=1 Tax=Podarcis lilfordi TaxID=74358 RepID=A0AA35P636_9SAUR|nr:Hypothetical predicted protein [Podarcis lilfordi]